MARFVRAWVRMDRSMLTRLRRCAVGAALLGSACLPGIALADSQGTEEMDLEDEPVDLEDDSPDD